MVKMIIVWLLAALFTANSIGITLYSNFNAGTLLMWGISLLLVGYGLFHRQIDAFCRYGFGRILGCAFLAGVLLFCGMFAFVAVSGYTAGATGQERAIIVLGAGLRGERVGDVLRRRLEAALAAWQQNPNAVLVVTGGQGPQESIPEAVAMKRWLVEHGVDDTHIITEDKSVSTEENLLFAKHLLAEAGVPADAPVAVVTNAFHCYRAGQYARKLGFAQVSTVPASMNTSALLPSYMREILAILYMWVFRRRLA